MNEMIRPNEVQPDVVASPASSTITPAIDASAPDQEAAFLRKARMCGTIALNALRSCQLVYDRYIRRKPVLGSMPHETRLHDLYWERRLPAGTDGWAPVSLDDGMLYEATPYLLLGEILRTLDLHENDVFVDLGCGKGRTLCMAGRTSVCRVVGVEQDPAFLDVARRNLEAMPGLRAEVELVEGLAQEFDLSDTTVLFLFNPFGAQTLEQVIARLTTSLAASPRPLRIVYVNPVHEVVLHRTPWLARSETWPSSAFPDFVLRPETPLMVSFWENKFPS